MASTAVAPASVGVKVGDFFYSSWGYDQTNVDFYKVVGLTPKGVKVQKWTSAVVSGSGGPSEGVVPGEGPVTSYDYSAAAPGADYWDREAAKVEVPAEVRTHRLYEGYKGSGAFTINSYSSAWHWDGTPQHQTGSYYHR